MITKELNIKIHIALTSALAFLIPVFPNILPLIIILLGINFFIIPSYVIAAYNEIKTNSILLSMIGLYVLYLLGMLYSNNLKFGAEVIETKLSFLILPFIYGAYKDTVKEKFNIYLLFFIAGCLVYVLMCLGYASYCYLKPVYIDLYGVMYYLGADYFYYSQLSFLFHPSYAAMYALFSLLSILYLRQNKAIRFSVWWILAVFLLVLFVLLLSSKAGWISLFSLLAYVAFLLIRLKKIIFTIFLSALVIGLFFILNVFFAPKFSQRIPQYKAIQKVVSGNEKTSTDGSASRVLVWKAAVEIIKENIVLGVGTGDTKDKMLEKYKEMSMIKEYESKLNAHNQFLNTGVAIGILGSVLLISSFILLFLSGIKSSNMLGVGFSLLLVFNFLTESMLETQAGVIFCAFWLVQLGLYLNKRPKATFI